jgi:hypothetical protein
MQRLQQQQHANPLNKHVKQLKMQQHKPHNK